jgi:hypothetical protein
MPRQVVLADCPRCPVVRQAESPVNAVFPAVLQLFQLKTTTTGNGGAMTKRRQVDFIERKLGSRFLLRREAPAAADSTGGECEL